MDILKLKSNIIKYNNYYRKGEPLISDYEYDNLLYNLKQLIPEDEYLEFRKTLFEKPGKFKHPFIIGSLNKAKYDKKEELINWIKKENISDILISEKLDGNSIVLYYNRDGILSEIVTRGNGEYGEIITDKLINCKFIPNNFLPNSIVRGEIIIHNSSFEYIKNNFIEYKDAKNPRNLVAGILHKDEVDNKLLDNIKFYAFRIMNNFNNNILDHFKMLSSCFMLPNYFNLNLKEISVDNINDVLKDLLVKYKESNDYNIDGLVLVSLNHKLENDYLPKKSISFKLDEEYAETYVKNILWETSKTGKVVPVAICEKVELNGTEVTNASLFNASMVIDKSIGIGSKISIFKSGEIIPSIKDVIIPTEPNIPEICDNCGEKLTWDDNKVNLICPNKECSIQNHKKIVQFLNNYNIKGFDVNYIKQFRIDTLYKLIEFIPDTSYKLQVKLRENIDKYIMTSPKELLFINYPFNGISNKITNKLLKHYGFDNIINKEFNKEFPEGIKEKSFSNFYNQLDDFVNFYVYMINNPDYKPIEYKKDNKVKNNKLNGLTFCLTGTMTNSRKFYENLIIENGGNVLSSVSKKLNYLVVGDNAGSKLTKAKSLGINILNENKLLNLIKD